jgi:hypothetical protein
MIEKSELSARNALADRVRLRVALSCTPSSSRRGWDSLLIWDTPRNEPRGKMPETGERVTNSGEAKHSTQQTRSQVLLSRSSLLLRTS